MPSLTLSRRTALVLAAAALAALFAAAHLLGPGAKAKPRVVVQSPVAGRGAAAAAGPRASSRIVVDVTGAVRRPGVYRLPGGARVADAIARAGGATRRAEATLVNLAAPLVDGQQVVMPSRAGAAGVAAGPAEGAAGPASAPVDLNTASVAQLETLPGVGPVTAQKIVAYRQAHGPFASLAALDAIPGIGPARIAELEGLVLQR